MPRFLIVGQGSMGKRRVRCLLANQIPPGEIAVFDTRDDRIAESREKYGITVAGDVDAALKDPALQAVFVSVPGFLHYRYCHAAARAGKHWFCEVPLSTTLDGLQDMFETTRKNKLVGAPGCQVLFHPLAQALHDWSRRADTGKIVAASYTFGSYLPDWHPYEDYRKFYASDQSMGGGNLDVIAQELVWLRWIIGKRIASVTCRMSKVGSLELAEGTPDHQEMIVEFDGGLMLSMHFDINDHVHERAVRFVSASSTAKWSGLEPRVRFYQAGTKEWTDVSLPDGFQGESPYHLEVGKFLRCIDGGETWPVELDAAREIVALLVAMPKSDAEGRRISLL